MPNLFELAWKHCDHLALQVDIYESRFFIGGKVGSFSDKRGNHIEMGLHVFFGCYNNLFRLMKKVTEKLFVTVIFYNIHLWLA